MLLTFFTTSFLFITFLLQWWIRPSYPLTVWFVVCCLGFLGFLPFGKLPFRDFFRAFGGSDSLRRASLPVLIISCTLGIAFALWNVARTEYSIMNALAHIPFGTARMMEGMVTGLPVSREGTVTYTVTLRTITNMPTQPSTTRKITVRMQDVQARFTHGDIVQIHGTIEPIPPPYDRYFRAHRILGSVSYPRVTGTGQKEGSYVRHLLAQWNAQVALRIRDLIPEPEASLLIGLLLGETGGFSRETLEAFRTAGLAHILAVSGYNITLLLIAVSVLVMRLPPVIRFVVTCGTVVLFTLLVGGSPSAIRAALMGGLGLLALHTRHLPDTRRTILLAACLMLLWNPMQLWWDASFQLSFLAVIGITELQPTFKKILRRIPDSCGIRETLTVTLAAQCAALPWAAALFGNFPIVSPIANVLVAPFIPFIMIAGPIALLGGTVHDFIGRILAFPCWVALRWIVGIAERLALIPFASISFPTNTLLPILLYYTILIAVLGSRGTKT